MIAAALVQIHVPPDSKKIQAVMAAGGVSISPSADFSYPSLTNTSTSFCVSSTELQRVITISMGV